jgi:hypothetical protein
MEFVARKRPDAVTIGRLIEQGLPLGVHCLPCGCYAALDPAALPLAPTVPVPALEGRFRCGRCGSRDTTARPEYGAPSKPDAGASLVVR